MTGVEKSKESLKMRAHPDYHWFITSTRSDGWDHCGMTVLFFGECFAFALFFCLDHLSMHALGELKVLGRMIVTKRNDSCDKKKKKKRKNDSYVYSIASGDSWWDGMICHDHQSRGWHSDEVECRCVFIFTLRGGWYDGWANKWMNGWMDEWKTRWRRGVCRTDK